MRELEKKAISLFEKTLDKKSKWYWQDITDFTNRIKIASDAQLKKSIANMSYMNSKQSDIDFNRETKKLEQAGLFDIRNMKPINALD